MWSASARRWHGDHYGTILPLAARDRFIQADVSTRAGIDHVVQVVMERLGGLDIVIHNVGGSAAPGGGALALSDAAWQQAFDTNLFAAVRPDRAFLPAMVQQGAGVIIHVSSIQRTLPLFDATLAYAAAKAALTTYSKGLSKEVGPKGIRVNTVAPGYTETEAAQGMVNEIAHRTGISQDAARQRIMEALGGIPSAGRTARRRWPNWSPSSPRTARRPSPAASTSSMAGPSRRCD